jgi:Glycosyl hydrolases family 43
MTAPTIANQRIKRDCFTPGAIWPDTNGEHINAHGGGILFHDGVHYWFGEHKTQGSAGNLAQVGVGCYASKDLYNWENRGIALAVSDDPDSPIARGCILERPKVIYHAQTRRFVMWFHLESKGVGYAEARSGLAISSRAIGPYQFLRSFRPNAGVWPLNVPEKMKRPLAAEELASIDKLNLQGGPTPGYPPDSIFRRDFAGGQMARDMTLFVDEDGSAYHLHASEENGVLHISQLSDDYLSSRGRYVRLFPGQFREAPAICKHLGKYYLFTSGCTGWKPNPTLAAVADSIFGPWRELGNPFTGPSDRVLCSYQSQPTFVLPVAGQEGAFIYMADRWNPDNAIDGRYVWLPVQFRDGRPRLEWEDQWDLP